MSKIKKGDSVLVTRVDRRWDYYCTDLDRYVGMTLVVDEVNAAGIKLLVDEGEDYWNFNEAWLKKINAKATKKKRNAVYAICEELSRDLIPTDTKEAIDYIFERVDEIQNIIEND